MTRRPDAGAQQMRWRVNRSGRDDDFAASEFDFLAVYKRSNPDAVRPLEYQLLDLHRGRNLEIAPQPGARIEIADRCRYSPLVEIGYRDREIAVLELGILVLDVFEASLIKRRGDGL